MDTFEDTDMFDWTFLTDLTELEGGDSDSIRIQDLLAEPESLEMEDVLYPDIGSFPTRLERFGMDIAHQYIYDSGTMQSENPLNLANSNFLEERLQAVTGENHHAPGLLESEIASRVREDMSLRWTGTNYSLGSCSSGLTECVTGGAEAFDLAAGAVPESVSKCGHLKTNRTVQQNTFIQVHQLHHGEGIREASIVNLEGSISTGRTLNEREISVTKDMHSGCGDYYHGVESSFKSCSPGLTEVSSGAKASDLLAGATLLASGPGFLERVISSRGREDMDFRCSSDSQGTNSSLGSCSSGLTEWGTSGAEALDLAAGTMNPVPESTSNQTVLYTNLESHQAFRRLFESPVKERNGLVSFIAPGSQNFIEMENGPGFLEREISSTECGNFSYGIESSSKGFAPDLSEVSDGAAALDLLVGSTNSVPDSSLALNILDDSSLPFESFSSGLGERVTDGTRALTLSADTVPESGCGYRKRKYEYRTSSEVENLIQGVDELGIGKWTELKRKFFGSSQLTADQIRIQWRTLLKASKAHLDTHPKKFKKPRFPPDVLERVKEVDMKHRTGGSEIP